MRVEKELTEREKEMCLEKADKIIQFLEGIPAYLTAYILFELGMSLKKVYGIDISTMTTVTIQEEK